MSEELPKATIGEMMSILKTLAENGKNTNTSMILSFLREVFGLSDKEPIAKPS